MATFITDIGLLVSGAVSWVTSWVGSVTSNDFILMFALIPLVGFGIGALRRLISVN